MSELKRFLDAQDAGGAFERALAELRAGRKAGHWMWFVFPQLAGLGHSSMARAYAIAGLEEARSYLRDPVLGERLRACCRALLDLPPQTRAEAVLGGVDALKLRSSMTLFARAAPDEPLYREVLERYYAGEPDGLTEDLLELLGRHGSILPAVDLGAPISYLVLEPGVPVLSSDGQEIGRVAHVLADEAEDVFDGIVIGEHRFGSGHRFADADDVGEIHERGVVLTLDQAACERLPEPSANPAVMHDDPAESKSDLRRGKLMRAWDRISGNY